jgi:hypothetical protein
MNVQEFHGYPSFEIYRELCDHFQPFVMRGLEVERETIDLLQVLHGCNELVDLSCTEPGEDFNGNPLHREAVQVKLSDCIEAYKMFERNERHWLLKSGLRLYLSQLCLYAIDESAVQVKVKEAFDSKPAIIFNELIDGINVWINFEECSSTLHYDANHNILKVLKGKKTVTLINPNLTHLVHPINAFVESPNHAEISVADMRKLLLTLDESSRKGNVYELTVNTGDAIFIPEGWWHQVSSDKATFAINYWFHSAFHSILNTKHMQAYLLRHVVHSLTEFTTEQAISSKHKIIDQDSIYKDMTDERFYHLVESILFKTDEDIITKDLITLVSCTFEAMEQYWLSFAKQVRIM